MAIKNLPLAGTKAADFYKLARAYDPQFAALTANLTLEQLQAGYAGSPDNFGNIVNAWYGVVLAMRLQKITVADFKEVVNDLGIVESYESTAAAISERLYIYNIESLDPAWLGEDGNGLKDGDTVDPWVVMHGTMKSMFWKTNFNFQTGVTIQPFETKQILSTDFGMDEITAGYIRQLYVTYGKERQLAILDCLNALINSEDFPLLESQKLAVSSWSDTDGINSVTADEILELLSTINGVAMEIDASISTGAYNAEEYDTAVDKENMRILMRPEIMNKARFYLRAGTYNPDDLNLLFDVKYLKNFGGMIPTDSSGNVLYPVRTGKLKRFAGWSPNQGDATPVITDKKDVVWVDPNEDVLAIIIQKGAIFTTDQNGIRVRPTGPNPRAEYENFFFNLINAGIHFDPHYNVVIIVKPGTGTSTPSAIKEANAAQIAALKATAKKAAK